MQGLRHEIVLTNMMLSLTARGLGTFHPVCSILVPLRPAAARRVRPAPLRQICYVLRQFNIGLQLTTLELRRKAAERS